MHAVLPAAGWTCPLGQAVHVSARSAEYEPGWQSSQVAELAKVPPLHAVQAIEPSGAAWPVSQARQSVCSLFWYVPAAHLVHSFWPTEEYSPRSHGKQPVLAPSS